MLAMPHPSLVQKAKGPHAARVTKSLGRHMIKRQDWIELMIEGRALSLISYHITSSNIYFFFSLKEWKKERELHYWLSISHYNRDPSNIPQAFHPHQMPKYDVVALLVQQHPTHEHINITKQLQYRDTTIINEYITIYNHKIWKTTDKNIYQ